MRRLAAPNKLPLKGGEMKKAKGILVASTVLGIAFVLALTGRPYAADEGTSSSECIKCHTDLKKMDTYGAASSGGAAAIAG
jgi:hypothetical protein